jgi:hypothetical protein
VLVIALFLFLFFFSDRNFDHSIDDFFIRQQTTHIYQFALAGSPGPHHLACVFKVGTSWQQTFQRSGQVPSLRQRFGHNVSPTLLSFVPLVHSLRLFVVHLYSLICNFVFLLRVCLPLYPLVWSSARSRVFLYVQSISVVDSSPPSINLVSFPISVALLFLVYISFHDICPIRLYTHISKA